MRMAINHKLQVGWTYGEGSRWYSDWLHCSQDELGTKSEPHHTESVFIDFANPKHQPRIDALAEKLGIDLP